MVIIEKFTLDKSYSESIVRFLFYFQSTQNQPCSSQTCHVDFIFLLLSCSRFVRFIWRTREVFVISLLVCLSLCSASTACTYLDGLSTDRSGTIIISEYSPTTRCEWCAVSGNLNSVPYSVMRKGVVHWSHSYRHAIKKDFRAFAKQKDFRVISIF